ncbi:hypothetical protein MANES_04G067140v8 [Manihot esculenta]|uniref:Uncharacterized protein n=1 Tax=Manihot esculenta TaxID=3983 RepID=A0ACB7HSZ6_MANES|nr:hypothetical protein MANES_04G067140v8 [Manihot esculenta]
MFEALPFFLGFGFWNQCSAEKYFWGLLEELKLKEDELQARWQKQLQEFIEVTPCLEPAMCCGSNLESVI